MSLRTLEESAEASLSRRGIVYGTGIKGGSPPKQGLAADEIRATCDAKEISQTISVNLKHLKALLQLSQILWISNPNSSVSLVRSVAPLLPHTLLYLQWDFRSTSASHLHVPRRLPGGGMECPNPAQLCPSSCPSCSVCCILETSLQHGG
jgi:hypothetical protein